MRREIPQKVDAQIDFADWSRSTSAVRFGATLFRRTRSASVLSITLTATTLGILLSQQNASAHLALGPTLLGTLNSSLQPVNSDAYLPLPSGSAGSGSAASDSEVLLSSPVQATVWQVQEASVQQAPVAFSTTSDVLSALTKNSQQPGFASGKTDAIPFTNASIDISAAIVEPESAPSQATANLEQKILPNPGGSLLQQPSAVVHTVEKGENLTEIADKYRVSLDSIAETNRIPNPNVIDVNEDLVIPAATLSAAASSAVAAVLAQGNSSSDRIASSTGSEQLTARALPKPSTDAIALMPTPTRNSTPTILEPAPNRIQIARRSFFPQIPPLDLPSLTSAEQFLPSMLKNGVQKFIWPSNGVFTSGYGWRWGRMHRGIDIAAPVGTPIVASGSGIVISAGWNSGGFGNLVEIRHPDGTVTRYAHNSTITTRVGAVVNQGETIAQMGSTGRSTGPHCHFEIRPGGQGSIDPMFFLSRR
ncbi:peptidoglycan DD-metalloendopeptidase family protein [Altericista sp. CCNU0014]|uniref:peptidoglycan DD-metalloendopeptidase family protein n=1 Tax=Altericista sp. CCNU0014 TaxID=3082949 RepID=UPI003850A186